MGPSLFLYAPWGVKGDGGRALVCSDGVGVSCCVEMACVAVCGCKTNCLNSVAFLGFLLEAFWGCKIA